MFRYYHVKHPHKKINLQASIRSLYIVPILIVYRYIALVTRVILGTSTHQ